MYIFQNKRADVQHILNYSVFPFSAKKRSASIEAIHPVPAALIACR
jgi:hypothetical protein